MKKQTALNFSKINKEHIHYLTTEVNKTIATDFVAIKAFTAADL